MSGTMVSALVLTAAPVEVDPRPEFAIELFARLRAVSVAIDAVVGFFLALTTVPATALVACVPPTDPPDVLIIKSRSVSGFCQNSGATSMTT